MELRNLKTFIKVAELRNFSKAASELGYAQSTVSMQIQQLEQELNIQLFSRNGKFVFLSPSGESLLPYAYQMVKYEKMAIEHFQLPLEPEGHLNIGIMESICASSYTEYLYRFMEKYPKISLKFQIATTYEAIDSLEKGKLDLIFLLDYLTKRPDWITAHTITDEICFFCSANHPLALKKELFAEDLLSEPFLFVEERCNYRYAFEQFLASKGLEVPSYTEIGHTRFIIDAVAHGLGISLLPYCTLQSDLEAKRIIKLSVKDCNIQMYIQAIYNKKRWTSPALRALILHTQTWK